MSVNCESYEYERDPIGYQSHFEHDIFAIAEFFTNEFYIKNCTMSITW